MFDNIAYAQDVAVSQGGGAIGSLLPLVLIFVLFYFLLIRPQQKKTKEHRKMLEQLAVGDEVITGGGIMGKIEVVNDSDVVLNLGDSQVRFQKQSVQAIIPKGTIS